jgi:hypothetical protein
MSYKGWISVPYFYGLTGGVFPNVSEVYYQPDEGFYWRWKDSFSGNYYITSGPTPGLSLTITINGAQYAVAIRGSHNGYPTYFFGGIPWCVWNNFSTWYISTSVGTNTGEYAYTGSDGATHYLGDSWWILNSFLLSQSGSSDRHGINIGDGTKVLTWAFSLPDTYWQYDPSLGIYSPHGGAAGNLYFGKLILTDDHGSTYTQGQPPDSGRGVLTSNGVYGDISYDLLLGQWIIGTKSSAPGTGYWKTTGALPKQTSATALFTRVWNTPGTDPTPYNLTVSFSLWDATKTFTASSMYLAGFGEYL